MSLASLVACSLDIRKNTFQTQRNSAFPRTLEGFPKLGRTFSGNAYMWIGHVTVIAHFKKNRESESSKRTFEISPNTFLQFHPVIFGLSRWPFLLFVRKLVTFALLLLLGFRSSRIPYVLLVFSIVCRPSDKNGKAFMSLSSMCFSIFHPCQLWVQTFSHMRRG